VHRLVQVDKNEVTALVWSTAFFFCLLTGYFILRPVRETWGIEVGPNYHWLWTGTAVGTLLATPVFGWFVSRLPRRRFVPLVYWIAIACLLGFYVAYESSSRRAQIGVGYAFYIWLSVFNLFQTAVFWGFMADVWSEPQGKRLFGFIAAGGTLGALFGGLHVKHLNGALGTPNLLLVSIPYYALAIACIARLVRIFGDERPGDRADWVPRTGLGEALAGIGLFVRSRYLRWIGVFLAAQTYVAAVLYIETRSVVSELLPDRGARTNFFAQIDIGYNALALVVQVFLTGRLVRWCGLGAMLAVVPMINFGGFWVLATGPTLAAYGVFEILQRGSRFALMKPAREMLFTVLDREEKYKAKQFLDTAVYRSTDAVWAWIVTGTRLYLVLPICVGWTLIGPRLASIQRRLAAARGSVPTG
jgi:AAA family ATP:ADP antiporter